MARLGSIFVDVRAKTDKYKRDLAKAKTMTAKAVVVMKKQLDKINFKRIGVAAVVASGIIIVALKKVTDAAKEQEAVEKRLESVIKSTGMAAGFNIDQMKDMAAAMQEVTTIGDETILSGMAMLSTFKQIRGEGFERTMAAALDLSEVMQQDLRSSIVMLGKALNDPVANLGALSRAGIQFTKDQKEVIKSLWQSGKQVEAQSILLKELESQFGGAAKAARNTFGGAMKAAENAFGDMLEEIGFAITKNEELIKIIHDTEQAFIDAGDAVGEWIKQNDKLIKQRTKEVLSGIYDNLKNIIDIYNSIPSGVIGPAGYGVVGAVLFGGQAGKIILVISLINEQLGILNMGIGDLWEKSKKVGNILLNPIESIFGGEKSLLGEEHLKKVKSRLEELEKLGQGISFLITDKRPIDIKPPSDIKSPPGKVDNKEALKAAEQMRQARLRAFDEDQKLLSEKFHQEIEFMNAQIEKEKEAEEERLEIVKSFNEQYNEIGKTRFDLEREQVERMTEIYREAGIEENMIAKLTADKNKQIAEAERQAKLSIYQNMAGGIAETFQMIAQAGGKQSLAAFRTFQAFAAIEAAIAGDKAVSLALADTTIPSTIGRFAMAGIAGAKAALQVGLIMSAQPPSFDSGGVSSARGVYQTGNIQEAHVPIPSGKIPVEINGGQEQAPQEIVIMNTVDPSVMDRYMASSRGQNAILNAIGNNPQAIRRISR